jgi:hypothetical protein
MMTHDAKMRRMSRKSVRVSEKSVGVSHSAREAGGRLDAGMTGDDAPASLPRCCAPRAGSMAIISDAADRRPCDPGAATPTHHYPRPAARPDHRTRLAPPAPAPPPAPPAAAGRRHRFPRSHGPAEHEVNKQCLTLRCHERPQRQDRLRPSHSPRGQKCRRNPKPAGILANLRARNRPWSAWLARRRIRPTRCEPSRPTRAGR